MVDPVDDDTGQGSSPVGIGIAELDLIRSAGGVEQIDKMLAKSLCIAGFSNIWSSFS